MVRVAPAAWLSGCYHTVHPSMESGEQSDFDRGGARKFRLQLFDLPATKYLSATGCKLGLLANLGH